MKKQLMESNFQIYTMHSMKNLLMVAFSFSLTILSAQEETIAPKYSNEFLSIGVGADALGLGNSVVAQTGSVTSGYWNPAGLTQVNKWLDVGLMHSEYFAGIAKYDFLGLAHAIDDKSTIGFSAIRFAVDDIPNTTQLIDNAGNINYDNITTFTAADYGFLFSYARKLKVEGLSIGGNFKVIHRKVGDFAKSWGFGLDAGAQYHLKEIDLDITTDGRRNTLLRTGLVSVDPHMGIEFGFKSYVAIRGGISNLQYVKDFDDNRSLNLQPNIGVGLAIKNFHLDYAFTDIGDASVALYSHVISLRIKLDPPKNMVAKE